MAVNYKFIDLKIFVNTGDMESTGGEGVELEVSNGDQVLFICQFFQKLGGVESVFPLNTNGAPTSLRHSVTASRTKSASQLAIQATYNDGKYSANEDLATGLTTALVTFDPTNGIDDFLGTDDQKVAHFEIQWEDAAGVVSTLFEAPILIKQQGDSTPNPAPTPAVNYLLSSEVTTNILAASVPLRANTLLRMLRDVKNSNYAMHEQLNIFADEFADESDTDAAETTAPYSSTYDSYDNAAVAAAEQPLVNTGGTQKLGNDSGTYVDQIAQGFQLATGQTISSASIKYYYNTGNAGSIEMRIETDSGGEPSGTLADPGLTADIGTPYSWLPAVGTFTTPAALLASTQYHLVLKLASDPGTGNNVSLYGHSTNAYADGIAAYRTGAAWAAMSGILDLSFAVNYANESAQVQSDAHTASTGTGRCVLISYATLGTGTITYAVSRDGGTTFTTATMTTLSVDAGITYTQYYSDVDISAQPAGTAMKIRATITGDATLYGWGLDYNG